MHLFLKVMLTAPQLVHTMFQERSMSALRDHERIGRYSNLEWFSKIGGEQETNLYT